MLLLGCLLVVGFSIAPRAMLVLAWLFSDRWQVVWSGEWLWPLLGIIFVPYTTIMYVLVWDPAGFAGTDWLWIVLGLMRSTSCIGGSGSRSAGKCRATRPPPRRSAGLARRVPHRWRHRHQFLPRPRPRRGWHLWHPPRRLLKPSDPDRAEACRPGSPPRRVRPRPRRAGPTTAATARPWLPALACPSRRAARRAGS
jgi:hypothetical protein